MNAIVFHGFGDAHIESVPRPAPAADEALVAIDRVQLSVTECNLYFGNEIAHYEEIERRLSSKPARLFGHEFCGRVVETGADVTTLESGDRVYAPGKVPCHDCRQCQSGFEIHCPEKTYIGYDIPGALAEYAALPAEALCSVPKNVSDAETAAMQPLASSILCVREAEIDSGDVVAVIGDGVMGYQCAQLALIHGARTVIVIDIDQEKLAIAEDRGLVPVNADETDPVKRVRELTDGIGADVVFEGVGGEQTAGTNSTDPLAQAVDMARPGGTVVQVGYIIGDISITPRAIRTKSIDWINPTTGVISTTPNTSTGQLAAEFVASDRVSIKEYITHELEGLEAFEQAVDITLNKESHEARGPAQLVLE